MWWAGSRSWQLYLGRSVIGIAEPSEAPCWIDVGSLDEGWRVVEAKLAEKGSRRQVLRVGLKVFLSGALARPFVIPPVTGVRRWRELLQIAEGLAPEATGLAGPCAVWLATAKAGEACLAVAAERVLVNEIASQAARLRMRLLSSEPWWTLALNEALTRSPAPKLLAVEDSDALTILSGDNGAFASAATYAPPPPPGQLQALLARATLNEEADATAAVLTARLAREPFVSRTTSSGREHASFRPCFGLSP